MSALVLLQHLVLLGKEQVQSAVQACLPLLCPPSVM
jgi:hypothetical protein